jgi:S1-C subfamily serine protease
VTSGNQSQSAVMADSPAKAAGLKDNDIILQIDGQKIDSNNTLSSIIANHNVGDKINLTVLRGKDQLTLTVTLAERKQ